MRVAIESEASVPSQLVDSNRQRKWKAFGILFVALSVIAMACYGSSKHILRGNSKRVNIANALKQKSMAKSDIGCSGGQVCIPAGNRQSGKIETSYGTWVVRQTGVISGLKLTYVSGESKLCGEGSGSNCKGRWGTTRGDLGYFVYVVRGDGKSVLFPTAATPNVISKSYGAYRFAEEDLTEAQANGNEFVMTFGSEFPVTKGETLRFYNTEMFNKNSYGDNFGQTCATVTPVYVTTPSTKVCIPASAKSGFVANAFGAMVAPQSGVVKSVTMTKTSGGLAFCNPHDANCVGTFGAKIVQFQVYMTRANPEEIVFPIGGTKGIEEGPYNGYKLPVGESGLSANSLTIDLGEQNLVKGEELKFWVGETLFKGAYGDNSNKLCVDVAFTYCP